MNKICTKCGQIKNITEFYKQKLGKFGVHSVCKTCFIEKQEIYQQSENGKITSRKSTKKYQNTPAGKIVSKKSQIKYCQSDKGKKNRNKYAQSEPCKILQKKYRQTIQFKNTRKKYRNLPKTKELNKIYNTIYNKKRYSIDQNYKIIRILGSRTRSFIKGQKSASTEKLLGCSYEFARKWIEAQFTPEMNWNNIHIDHVRPLSSFIILEKEQFKACDWRNLQPLLKKNNLEKSDSWDGTDENLTFSKQSLSPEAKRELIHIFEQKLDNPTSDMV